MPRPTIKLELNEAQLFTIAQRLCDQPEDDIFYMCGRMYGIRKPDRGTVSLELFQYIMKEWDDWATGVSE